MIYIKDEDWYAHLNLIDECHKHGAKSPSRIIVSVEALQNIDSVVIVLSDKTVLLKDCDWFGPPMGVPFHHISIVDSGKTLKIGEHEFPVEVLLLDKLNQDGPKFVVRLYDMFDGWIDVTGPMTKDQANAEWMARTADGTRHTSYDDGDYYKVFPANTQMLVTPEFRGR